jgi:hypothetical protein
MPLDFNGQAASLPLAILFGLIQGDVAHRELRDVWVADSHIIVGRVVAAIRTPAKTILGIICSTTIPLTVPPWLVPISIVDWRLGKDFSSGAPQFGQALAPSGMSGNLQERQAGMVFNCCIIRS